MAAMDVALAVEHQTGFTIDLFKQYVVNDVAKEANAVMSPISIALAMSMAGAGARGTTLEEITSVLKVPQGDGMHLFTSQIKDAVLKDGSDLGGPLLSFTSGLWVDKSMTLKPKFQDVVKASYGAQVRTADFGLKAEEERGAINSWVSEETKEKIKELLPVNSLNERTALVLANALYFKGAWSKKFAKEDTKNHDFYLLNGSSLSVPFLTSSKKQYIRSFDTHKVLKLPYAKGQDHRAFSMYFVLPNDRAGLPELEKKMDAKSISRYLEWTSQEVKVGKFLLPKFKISTGFTVPESLKSMGMKAPFSDKADFCDMVEGPNASALCITDVFHKSFVEVNEEGTEAAAATAAVVMLRGLPVDITEDFVADHPFLFILKDDVTNVVLFIGRMINPSLSD